MKQNIPKQLARFAVMGVLLMWAVLFATQGGRQPVLEGVEGVRGKSPALPMTDVLTPEEVLAQDLALSDPRVQDLTVGKRSEVFSINRVGMHFPASSAACATSDCRQVEIYIWAENTTVTAIVDVVARQVVDVLHQPGIRPGIPVRLVERAVEIIHTAPEVAETLGYQPAMEDIAPMQGDLLGTSCGDGTHICVAASFRLEDRVMWAVADSTEDKLAGIGWSSAAVENGTSTPFTPQGCTTPGSVNQDGWTMSYETTNSDGFRVYNVAYNGVAVATSIKLAEWHADYGTNGYVDATGCSPSGGFPINPYGETVLSTLFDDNNDPVGFELIQDFRMGNWGQLCNYRYEQHMQFFTDGRFRVVSGAYGKGCGDNALYRPVVRMDLAVNGDASDNFDYYDGAQWIHVTTETYRVPYTETNHGPHLTDENGFAWKIYDAEGSGYYLEMDDGQFGGRGDDPFMYVTLHHANEGDTDLGAVGTCCNDNHMQGPHNYLNNESVANQNLVIWYVPQAITDAFSPDYYCWTIAGEPNPETYPCFMGPMFHPISPMGTTSGAISLQGRTDYSGAEISAFNGFNTYTAVTDAAGNFSLDVPVGTYEVSVEMEGYLDAAISGIEVTEGNTTVVPGVTLPGGDTNDSDKVNILDLALIGSHYGLNCGDTGWDAHADVNGDCTVNLLDLTLAASNFQNTSPVVWE